MIHPTGFIVRSRAQLKFSSLNGRKEIPVQGVLSRLGRSGPVARQTFFAPEIRRKIEDLRWERFDEEFDDVTDRDNKGRPSLFVGDGNVSKSADRHHVQRPGKPRVNRE